MIVVIQHVILEVIKFDDLKELVGRGLHVCSDVVNWYPTSTLPYLNTPLPQHSPYLNTPVPQHSPYLNTPLTSTLPLPQHSLTSTLPYLNTPLTSTLPLPQHSPYLNTPLPQHSRTSTLPYLNTPIQTSTLRFVLSSLYMCAYSTFSVGHS